jgi:hypothetical protein
MTKFCTTVCGRCPSCLAAKRDVEELDAVYATLSDEDLDSLYQKDPDDPRSFALDSKGRP